jgi:hypothetical protein
MAPVHPEASLWPTIAAATVSGHRAIQGEAKPPNKGFAGVKNLKLQAGRISFHCNSKAAHGEAPAYFAGNGEPYITLQFP